MEGAGGPQPLTSNQLMKKGEELEISESLFVS